MAMPTSLLLLLLVAILGAAQGVPSRPNYSTCVPFEYPHTIPHTQEGPVRNCCISAFMEGPKVYKEWKQYILENPLPKQPRVRPAAHLLDANGTYLKQVNRAFQLAAELPKEHPHSSYNLDNYHCMQGSAVVQQKGFPDQFYSVHQNWNFHPFHRWLVFFYERILGRLLGDDTFVLPFWQWENQTPKEPYLPNVLPWFFRRPDLFPALYSPNRSPTLEPGQPDAMVEFHPVWNWDAVNGVEGARMKDPEQLRRMNNAALHRWIAQAPLDEFLSIPLRGGDVYKDGVDNFENMIHSVIHFWVGDPDKDYGDMGAVYNSFHDPVLTIHHTNVDRIWAVWQSLGLPNYDSDPDYLDQEFFF